MISNCITKDRDIFLKFKDLKMTKRRFGANNFMYNMNNNICRVIEINLNDDKISLAKIGGHFDYYHFSFSEIRSDSFLVDSDGNQIDFKPYTPPSPQYFDINNLGG